jgi:hypothetical protein
MKERAVPPPSRLSNTNRLQRRASLGSARLTMGPPPPPHQPQHHLALYAYGTKHTDSMVLGDVDN